MTSVTEWNHRHGINFITLSVFVYFIEKLDGVVFQVVIFMIVYYRGRIVGGIYDDRLLVQPVKSAISLMPDATYELPYEETKEMLLVDDVDNKDFLTQLFNAMYDELPRPMKKKA